MKTLLLPWPPSVNTYWRTFQGRMILSKKGREYRKAVEDVCGKQTPFTGRLEVKIDVYPPDNRRRDLDNMLKGVLDGLEHGGVYLNDSQIDHIDMLRCAVTPPGRVVIQITEVQKPQALTDTINILARAK